MAEHDFTARIAWTGNRGDGTRRYHGYDRTWELVTPAGVALQCSNDPRLGGDPALPNPEDMLLASLAACHMLWYLHLASAAGIVVTDYADDPRGVAESAPYWTVRFVKAALRPRITLAAGSDAAAADAIHARIHAHCFIARSVAFPVDHAATYRVA